MAPGLSYETIGERISADIPAGSGLTRLRRRGREGRLVLQASRPVKDDRLSSFNLETQPGGAIAAIEVDFPEAGSG